MITEKVWRLVFSYKSIFWSTKKRIDERWDATKCLSRFCKSNVNGDNCNTSLQQFCSASSIPIPVTPFIAPPPNRRFPNYQMLFSVDAAAGYPRSTHHFCRFQFSRGNHFLSCVTIFPQIIFMSGKKWKALFCGTHFPAFFFQWSVPSISVNFGVHWMRSLSSRTCKSSPSKILWSIAVWFVFQIKFILEFHNPFTIHTAVSWNISIIFINHLSASADVCPSWKRSTGNDHFSLHIFWTQDKWTKNTWHTKSVFNNEFNLYFSKESAKNFVYLSNISSHYAGKT